MAYGRALVTALAVRTRALLIFPTHTYIHLLTYYLLSITSTATHAITVISLTIVQSCGVSVSTAVVYL